VIKGALIYALPLLVAGSSVARAQDVDYGPPPEVVQPTAPMPEQQPPPPPPPEAYPQVSPQPAPPVPAPAAGQWVYTGQYGWVWMPYGPGYTYDGAAGDPTPYSYVYYPRHGWTWLASPWVVGWGPTPHFGVVGPSRFAWYSGHHRAGYGWGRTPGYHAARSWYPGRAAYVHVAPGWSGGHGRAWRGGGSWRGGWGHGGHRGHR
jgi:hypothetical protein